MIIKVSRQFEKDVKKLFKIYKNIKKDLISLKNELLKNPKLGTSIGNNCYKIRIANSSIPTGKRGGFRIITLVKIEKDTIILLTIYSKTQKDDITQKELEEILKDYN